MNNYLDINEEIVVIHETDNLSCKSVFNIFWKANINIIYVVDNDNCFAGVITDGCLLKQIKANKQESLINRECSIVRCDDSFWYEEAERKFNKYHITTAIPVINKENRMCFEIRKKKYNYEETWIEEFENRIFKYSQSYYLRNELSCLKKLLEEQDIIIIGTEDRFDYILGKLELNKGRITYLDGLENPYEFMENNDKLMIDLSVIGYGGREDIYKYCNNGYSWKQFIDLIYKIIELEYCSKLYHILDNKYVTIGDYFKKYMVRKITVSKRSIFTASISKYLQKNHFNILEQKAVCREELLYNIKLNGIELNKKVGSYNEFITIECINTVEQLFILCKELPEKIEVLNFIFDMDLMATAGEQSRMEGSVLKNTSENKSLYTLGDNKDENYLTDLEKSFQFDYVRTFENDRVVFKDIDNGLVCIENGVRRTCYQPEKYKGTIYFLGGCTIWGASVEDNYTIPSLIQKKINQIGKKYRVVNMGNNLINASRLLEALDIKEDDMFVILFPFITEFVKENIPVIEIGERFHELRTKRYGQAECFNNMVQHCGTNGNIIYADIIFEELEKCLRNKPDTPLYKNKLHQIFRKNFRDLDLLYDYNNFIFNLQQKRGESASDEQKKVGCIVMNCNPFTLGHRYLVEYALSKVDYLYLFVVEEDKSYFSFSDRYEMVRRGTEDMENIAILGSGNMIASSVTFPAYFNKGEEKSLHEQPSVSADLRVFSQYIAPKAGIKYRFVGEEPKDPVTARYNTKMKEILTEFGMQVIEIPRKCRMGEVISASKIRELYEKKDFDGMRGFAPDTTIQYLTAKSRSSKEQD